MRRQHPFKIVKLMSKNFWLLLIPLVRGLIALRFDVYNWVRGAWLDILIILFILAAAYLRWYFTAYEFGEDSIHVLNGIFVRTDYTIPFASICAVQAERKFLVRPIKAVNIYLDTNAGIANTADLKLTIRLKEYEQLFGFFEKNGQDNIHTSYHPSRINLIIFSFLFSSTLSGVIFISTLLIQSGNILGESLLQNQFVLMIADAAQNIAPMLPPIAVGISLLILSGWMISFISNLLRHLGFKIERKGEKIYIQNGLMTKRNYFINSRRINYVDLRQNLLTKLFSVMSVHVDCSGYGKNKNEIPVFVPITTMEQVYSSLRLLLPDMKVIKGGVKPHWSYFTRYIWFPFYASIIIPIAGRIVSWLFPLWDPLIFFITVMLEIPFIWLLIVKFVAYLTTRISYDSNILCLTYSFGNAFHKVMIPRDKIAKITISRSFFQKFNKACDVRIYTTNEFTKCHKVIALPLKDVLGLLNETDFPIDLSAF